MKGNFLMFTELLPPAYFPLYFLIVDEYEFSTGKLYKAIVFSEAVERVVLTGDTPLLLLSKMKALVAELPLWIYLNEDIITKHTKRIGQITDERLLEECISYAEKTPIPETPQGKYIKRVARKLAPYNTNILLKLFDDLENEEIRNEIV